VIVTGIYGFQKAPNPGVQSDRLAARGRRRQKPARALFFEGGLARVGGGLAQALG